MTTKQKLFLTGTALIGVMALCIWADQSLFIRTINATLLTFTKAHPSFVLVTGFVLAGWGALYAILFVGRRGLGEPIRVRDQLGYASLVVGKIALIYYIAVLRST